MRTILNILSLIALLALAFALPMHAACAAQGELCPKLAHAPLSKLKPGVPPLIYSPYGTFYVEMRNGKIGSDCYGETSFRPGQMGVVVLSDDMDSWHTRETLIHEVSHIAAESRDDGKCKFKDEDQAIEHLAPGWTDIIRDSRNAKLVEFLTK